MNRLPVFLLGVAIAGLLGCGSDNGNNTNPPPAKPSLKTTQIDGWAGRE